MKKFTCRDACKIFMILVMLVTINITSFAQDLKVVNVEEALKLVFENNIDLKIAQLTLDNSEIDWTKNQLSQSADTRSQRLNLELELAKNQDSYRQSKYNIISGVISDFIDLTKKRLTVEINEKQLQIKELELQRISELYDKGSATSTELMDARSDVESQKLTLYKAREDYKKLIDNLKNKTGLDGEVQFEELMLTINPFEIDLKTALEQAFDVSIDVKDKEIRNQLALLDLEKAQVEGKPELDMKKYLNNREIAQYRLLQTKDNLTQSIKDQLWDTEQSLKTIEVKTVELEIANENAKLTDKGFKQGFYTETQSLQSAVSLMNAKKDLFTAQADYILKLTKLYHQIGADERIGGEIR